MPKKNAAKIDNEIKKIIDDAHNNAIKILKENKVVLDKVSERLLEVETIDSTEFYEILKSEA